MKNREKIMELSNWLLNNFGDWLDADDTMMIAHHVYGEPLRGTSEEEITDNLEPDLSNAYYLISQQAAEIESLKQENESLFKERNNWMERCFLSEYLMSPDAHIMQPQFDRWKESKIKQQTHG